MHIQVRSTGQSRKDTLAEILLQILRHRWMTKATSYTLTGGILFHTLCPSLVLSLQVLNP